MHFDVIQRRFQCPIRGSERPLNTFRRESHLHHCRQKIVTYMILLHSSSCVVQTKWRRTTNAPAALMEATRDTYESGPSYVSATRRFFLGSDEVEGASFSSFIGSAGLFAGCAVWGAGAGIGAEGSGARLGIGWREGCLP